ncbi:hypothetical protein ABKN59_008102 [Abortiporus biennis]
MLRCLASFILRLIPSSSWGRDFFLCKVYGRSHSFLLYFMREKIGISFDVDNFTALKSPTLSLSDSDDILPVCLMLGNRDSDYDSRLLCTI